jgi:hypothetical protein
MKISEYSEAIRGLMIPVVCILLFVIAFIVAIVRAVTGPPED